MIDSPFHSHLMTREVHHFTIFYLYSLNKLLLHICPLYLIQSHSATWYLLLAPFGNLLIMVLYDSFIISMTNSLLSRSKNTSLQCFLFQWKAGVMALYCSRNTSFRSGGNLHANLRLSLSTLKLSIPSHRHIKILPSTRNVMLSSPNGWSSVTPYNDNVYSLICSMFIAVVFWWQKYYYLIRVARQTTKRVDFSIIIHNNIVTLLTDYAISIFLIHYLTNKDNHETTNYFYPGITSVLLLDECFYNAVASKTSNIGFFW